MATVVTGRRTARQRAMVSLLVDAMLGVIVGSAAVGMGMGRLFVPIPVVLAGSWAFGKRRRTWWGLGAAFGAWTGALGVGVGLASALAVRLSVTVTALLILARALVRRSARRKAYITSMECL